jgi:hypothetical protein
MGLKGYFIEKRIKKSLSGRNTGADKVFYLKKVAVFWDEHSAFQESHLKQLKNALNLEILDFEFFVFRDKKASYHKFHGIDITPGIINWSGKISDSKLREMLSRRYDLLIDYSLPDTLNKRVILAEIQAVFKVAFSDNDTAFYDLLISVPRNEVDLFNKELIRYMKILGFIS